MLRNITILRTVRWKSSWKRTRLSILMAGAFASVGALGQTPVVQSVVNAVTNDTVLSPGAVARVSGVFVGKPSVTVEGQKAYVFSSSATQILVHLPIELDPGVRKLKVVSENTTAVFNVTLQPYAPGLVRADSFGSGIGWFADDAENLINAQNPAHPGETIIASATGLGPTMIYLATGEISSDDKPTAANPILTVGGKVAKIVFAGLPATPDLALVGTYRITFVVPKNAPTGLDDVVLTIGGVRSNTVILPIEPATR
jgi:uncharacterized protein (TIGR03437 family)